MIRVCKAESIRKAEEKAASCGISYSTMMENAGYATVTELCKRKDVKGKSVFVICGSGNNGGDGYVVARLLNEKGAFCRVFSVDEPSSHTAQLAKKLYTGDCILKNDKSIYEADIIVDALFGTGLKRRLEGKYQDIVNAINTSSAYTVSVDIPSGLFADSGEETTAVKADLTVTFMAYKTCHLVYPARSFCGDIVMSNIGINDTAFEDIDIIGRVIEPPVFKKRESNTHKGTYGTAALIVGSYGMAGAAILALKGCLKSGVGIAKAYIPDSIYPMVTVSAPEAVCNVYKEHTDAKDICHKAFLSDALLIGCGLNIGDKQRQMLSYVIESYDKKLLIDADGINMLAEGIECIKHSAADIVLTPHSAEMARLCKVTTKKIEENRIFYAKTLAKELRCTVVLKGSVTVVSSKDGEVYFNVTGNPSMAKGGSGDTLSGIIVSLMAQGMDPFKASLCGVYVHGLAGDMARDKKGEISALPTDLIENLPEVFKKLGE